MHRYDIYDGLMAKVVWASKHIGDLQVECDRFQESYPYSIDIQRDPQTRETVYYLRSIRKPKPDIALIAGDVLNNLRSALDHLMWQFARQHVPVPHKRKVYFPITGSSMEYESLKSAGKIHYLRQNVIDALDKIEPYKGVTCSPISAHG